jgi:iron complex outermembrane receptor protein
MNRGKSLAGASLAACVCLTSVAPVASAQEEGIAALEQIIVTAQRREENLQRVPIAVSALGSEMLEEFDVRTIRDVSSIVPNLWMETNTGLSSGARASLRGIGEDESYFTSDTPVGMYIDDVYIPRQTGALFDLNEVERIEVLRGPQGTLYGRNTSAGAIKIVTRKPSDELRAHVELTAGDYSRLDARAGLSGPLTDQLAGQIAVLSRTRDGYDRNLVNGARVNDQDVLAGRVALQFAPTDSLEFLLAYDKVRERSTPGFATGLTLQPPDGLGAIDADDQVDGDTNVHTLLSDLTDPINDIDQQGASLTATWDVGGVTLKSITAWRELSNTLLLDADGQNSCFGAPLPCLHLFQDQRQDQLSQELQLQGKAFDERLTYILGAYYFEESNTQRTENIILSQFGQNQYSDSALDTDSIAVFTSLTFAITDRANLTAGVRWTRDSKDFNNAVFEPDGAPTLVCANPQTREVFGAGACGAGAPAGAITDELSRDIGESWSAVTPRLALDYQLTPEAMLYVSASEGFKSGSFDGREVGTALYSLAPIAPETVYTYEVGAKTEWFDRRLRANVAVFFNDFEDLQGTGTNQATGALTRFSVGDVETKGAEVELTAEPVRNLTVTGSLGLLDTKFTKINFDQVADCGPVGTGTKDLQLKFAPELAAFLGMNYRIPLAVGAIHLGGDWTHKSSFYHSSCNPLPSKEDGYDLLNAQVGYESQDGRWSVIAQMRNVTDEDYAAGQFFIPGLGFNAVYFNPPRTWALTVRYNLE